MPSTRPPGASCTRARAPGSRPPLALTQCAPATRRAGSRCPQWHVPRLPVNWRPLVITRVSGVSMCERTRRKKAPGALSCGGIGARGAGQLHGEEVGVHASECGARARDKPPAELQRRSSTVMQGEWPARPPARAAGQLGQRGPAMRAMSWREAPPALAELGAQPGRWCVAPSVAGRAFGAICMRKLPSR